MFRRPRQGTEGDARHPIRRADATLQERRIDVDGLPTRYLTAGDDGPPLVLLHGVGDNALDWR